MTKLTRFAALLAVLLVIGLASNSWADNGQPLILGQPNSATSTTELRDSTSQSNAAAFQIDSAGANIGLGVNQGAGGNGSGFGVYITGGGPALQAHSGFGEVSISDSQRHAALFASGNVSFPGVSGTVSITYPNSSTLVNTASVEIGTGDMVLATLQNNVGVWVKAAIPTPYPTNTIRIVLNKAPGSSANPKTAVVGSFLLGPG